MFQEVNSIMTSFKDIETVIKKVEKYIKRFEDPSVTQISNTRKDPYDVLISCILSLRTRDVTTLEASKRLFKLANTPEKMLRLSDKNVEEAIYPVGFYKTKTRNIRKINKILLEKYSGKVPEKFDDLLELHGVGRKTANIVMVYGFEKEGLPIDVHCHRIPNRLGWIQTKTPDQTEDVLRKILPKRLWSSFNNTFVTFGQNVCKPIGPKCFLCPVEKYCKYESKSLERR